MGIKGFIWLVLLAVVTLFVVQNLQPVSLVFLGSKSLTLPLSIWMLLFTITGIIVSLIIQSLINMISTNYTKDFKKPKKSYSSFPSQNKSSEIKPPFNQQSEEVEELQRVNPTYSEPYDDDFEFLTENNEKENLEASEIKDSGEDNLAQEKIDRDLNKTQADQIKEGENIEDIEVDSELKNQPRSPLLYSYKLKEKTRIDPLPKPPSPSPSPSTNEIYDANYRVIIPAPPKKNEQNNNDQIDQNENEEEWDF